MTGLLCAAHSLGLGKESPTSAKDRVAVLGGAAMLVRLFFFLNSVLLFSSAATFSGWRLSKTTQLCR